ncbi:MAG TPA: DapH/DapD/GlmU-related protein [Longilinea sp.]|nr:DapH/DapD/GlmU-related protein [Longilinea sp.]
MLKIILPSSQTIPPFNEPARDLRILNKPLWLYQRDVLTPYTDQELELTEGEGLPPASQPCFVYRNNLLFDENFIAAFLTEAKKKDTPSQAAFTIGDAAFREHCLPLSVSYTKVDDLYLADLWYYPQGTREIAQPLVINSLSREVGYYHIPTYMAFDQGDLVYQIPQRYCMAIDSWVHIFLADTVFGLFGRGVRFEQHLKDDAGFMFKVLAAAVYEGKQVLSCSKVVRVGKNCTIDPHAVIHGPTTIGDNVTIGAGVVIENCIIGDNVNISQGCQLMLSVVGDGTFLPFRAALFMTTLMDNCMVAQNTCLQMSVVGRNSFIGAGSTFTDFNLVSAPLLARDAHGELRPSNRPVLGACVGHNCRIGAGMVIYPGRTIESDTVLIASKDRRVIDHDVPYEQSDHMDLPRKGKHQRLYPRQSSKNIQTW